MRETERLQEAYIMHRPHFCDELEQGTVAHFAPHAAGESGRAGGVLCLGGYEGTDRVRLIIRKATAPEGTILMAASEANLPQQHGTIHEHEHNGEEQQQARGSTCYSVQLAEMKLLQIIDLQIRQAADCVADPLIHAGDIVQEVLPLVTVEELYVKRKGETGQRKKTRTTVATGNKHTCCFSTNSNRIQPVTCQSSSAVLLPANKTKGVAMPRYNQIGYQGR
jgi:hypothetical protein